MVGNNKQVSYSPGGQKPQHSQEVEVDLKNAVRKVCECGGKFFEPVCEVYFVSALVSPNGQELIVQKPVFVCIECKQELK